MIEVKLYLYDALEIQMMAQLEQALEMKRSQPPVMHAEGVGAPDAAPPTDITQADVVERAREVGIVEPEVLVADVPPFADDVAVMRAITEFAQREGVPAAKDLLKEFGATRVMDVPMERRNEFVARTVAR